MDWKMWAKGLGAAVLGGAVMSAGTVVQHRLQNGPNAPPINGANVGLNAGLGAIIAMLGYLTQSPMPALPAPQIPAQIPAQPPASAQ